MESLYRYYNAEGELLYIGISSQYAIRASQHSKKSPWYAESSVVKIEHCDSREDALAKEKKAIREERPKYNKLHNGWHGSARFHYDDLLKITRPLRDEWHTRIIDLALEHYEALITSQKNLRGYESVVLTKAFESAFRDLTQSGGDEIEGFECGGCEKVAVSGFFKSDIRNFWILVKENDR